MARILVIGWGNPLRGDDGIGWRAAERLKEALADREVTVRVAHQLMPEFAEEISRSDVVIFIDAACDNGFSGEIRFEQVEPRRSPAAAFSHQMDPPALLGMAEALYGRCPEAFFFTVRGRSFGYGEELSAEVQSALPALLEQIQTVCGATP
ncbi:MAG: hydrogenase maturation protease [Acidobacteriota bacterium]